MKANRKQHGKRKQERSIMATKNNAKNIANKKNRDLNQITCYIYNKKGYYTKDCIKPPKN